MVVKSQSTIFLIIRDYVQVDSFLLNRLGKIGQQVDLDAGKIGGILSLLLHEIIMHIGLNNGIIILKMPGYSCLISNIHIRIW